MKIVNAIKLLLGLGLLMSYAQAQILSLSGIPERYKVPFDTRLLGAWDSDNGLCDRVCRWEFKAGGSGPYLDFSSEEYGEAGFGASLAVIDGVAYLDLNLSNPCPKLDHECWGDAAGIHIVKLHSIWRIKIYDDQFVLDLIGDDGDSDQESGSRSDDKFVNSVYVGNGEELAQWLRLSANVVPSATNPWTMVRSTTGKRKTAASVEGCAAASVQEEQ